MTPRSKPKPTASTSSADCSESRSNLKEYPHDLKE